MTFLNGPFLLSQKPIKVKERRNLLLEREHPAMNDLVVAVVAALILELLKKLFAYFTK
jgi:hypothetical protein